jgi:4-amino-4-deoxy-L-arabinose transferase-like glycosyltransferase
MFSPRNCKIAVAAIALMTCLTLLWQVSEPWLGFYDANDSAFHSAIARNYLRYGVWELRFGQAVNFAPVSDLTELEFYQHHPPLLPLLVALSFALFGEREASARLVPIAFTLGNVLLIALLARKLRGYRSAVIATFIFATLPAVLYFGRKVGYEPPTLFFVLLAVWSYIRFLEKRSAPRLFTLFLMVGAGLLSDWLTYFLIPFISVHCWQSRGRLAPFRKSLSCGLPVFAAAVFAVFEVQSYLVDSSSLKHLIGQGLVYVGLMPADSEWAAQYQEAKARFGPLEFLSDVGERLDLLFAYPTILFSMAGIWVASKEDGLKRWVPFALLLTALLYCALFFRSTYIHMWWTYCLSAPLALLGGLGAEALLIKRGEIETHSHLQPQWNRTGLLFLVVLILVGSAVRLNSLHEKKIRLLPNHYQEKASFIKEVAKQVNISTSAEDTILTNLPWYGALDLFLNP